ncbi:hypothetical protein [Caballeronia sp. TF1N1]|uniref:hypothetical protein n=1 Tax=Caballeronia sp. TF1N1 TaxID=2878153 RepID=UPI001FD12591|nr:hypothetical protein [Caballeronia sp. TF1N1]
MFYLDPYLGKSESLYRYASLFWQSLNQPIYMSMHSPRMFYPAEHYSFGTSQHFSTVTRHELADISQAMQAARAAFLENARHLILLWNSATDLRTVLGRIKCDSSLPFSSRGFNELANGLIHAVERGELIFVPSHEDLRMCVEEIRKDRLEERLVDLPGSAFNAFSQAEAPHARLHRDSIRPFEYQPKDSDGDLTKLAARGVNEADEADCFAIYEREMEECQFTRAMYQDTRTYLLCTQRAFIRYQQCRGY